MPSTSRRPSKSRTFACSLTSDQVAFFIPNSRSRTRGQAVRIASASIAPGALVGAAAGGKDVGGPAGRGGVVAAPRAGSRLAEAESAPPSDRDEEAGAAEAAVESLSEVAVDQASDAGVAEMPAGVSADRAATEAGVAAAGGVGVAAAEEVGVAATTGAGVAVTAGAGVAPAAGAGVAPAAGAGAALSAVPASTAFSRRSIRSSRAP